MSRDCYFDEDDVLNSYYLFHIFRRPSKFFFNFLTIILVFVYAFLINILYILQLVFFMFYIPFKFLYIYSFIIALVLSIKLIFVLLYLIPILMFLTVLLLLYFVYRFLSLRYKNLNSQKFITFVTFFYFFKFDAVASRVNLLFFYFVFKIRSLNYLIFSTVTKFISINNLFNVGTKSNISKFGLKEFFNPDAFYANLIYYNSSFMFRRVKPYFLRLNNFQFIDYFSQAHNTCRLTPDQIKAFTKIGLNSGYPIYYFEKLFDLEYSKIEMEYEVPYYWAFARQMLSLDQGILHPKFHVYGISNFLKFYWNYFSFLSNNSIFEINYLHAHDMVQLFNSSASQIFSHLVNDFLHLTKTKNLLIFYETNIRPAIVKITVKQPVTFWYLFHVKYYDKLLRFF